MVSITLLAFPPAHAQECKNAINGHEFMEVEKGRQHIVRYTLKLNDPTWKLVPFSIHATALIQCANCISDLQPQGIIWLHGLDKSRHQWLQAQEDRRKILHGTMLDSWSFWPYGGALVAKHKPQPFAIGTMRGELDVFQESASSHGFKQDILYAHVHDNCGSLTIFLRSPPYVGDPPTAEATVWPILKAIDVIVTVKESPAETARKNYTVDEDIKSLEQFMIPPRSQPGEAVKD